MNAALAALFTTPIEIVGPLRMILLAPLAMSIAVVYKTTKLETLRDLVPATAALWVTIVVSMYAIGVTLWGLYHLFLRMPPF